MGARIVGVVAFVAVLSVTLAGCAAEQPEDADGEEGSRSTADELSSGTYLRCGYGCPAGQYDVGPACVSTCGGCNPYGRNATYCSAAKPASKVVCGTGCPAGYVAQSPLCVSTCGGCNPYGRNATQCVRGTSSGTSGGGIASSVTCGFSCPVGLRQTQRLCISTCGGCNPYGSNAVQCSR